VVVIDKNNPRIYGIDENRLDFESPGGDYVSRSGVRVDNARRVLPRGRFLFLFFGVKTFIFQIVFDKFGVFCFFGCNASSNYGHDGRWDKL